MTLGQASVRIPTIRMTAPAMACCQLVVCVVAFASCEVTYKLVAQISVRMVIVINPIMRMLPSSCRRFVTRNVSPSVDEGNGRSRSPHHGNDDQVQPPALPAMATGLLVASSE